MDVSVIVPAYNAAATISDCVTALQSQTLPYAGYEIIVVDDGSTDATAAIAAAGGARVLRQENQGQAAARNAGIRAAVAPIVAFTDADCAPAAHWLERLIKPLRDPAITGSKGAYRTRQPGLVPRFVQVEYEERYERMSRSRYIDFVDTYSAAYRRSVLLEHGGFDRRFPGDSSGEDQELSFRLTEQGHRFVFVPDALVYHRHPPTLAAYSRRKFKTGYWKALVLRLHPNKAVRDSHTTQALKLQILLLALAGPTLLAAAGLGVFWQGLGAVVLLLLASYAPFMAHAWRKDRPVALVSPFLLTVRSLALGSGLAAGLFDSALNRGALVSRLGATPADGKGT